MCRVYNRVNVGNLTKEPGGNAPYIGANNSNTTNEIRPPPPMAPPPTPPPPSVDLSMLTFVVSLGGFIVSIAGTGSTILLGWRADLRQKRELDLKLAQSAQKAHDT